MEAFLGSHLAQREKMQERTLNIRTMGRPFFLGQKLLDISKIMPAKKAEFKECGNICSRFYREEIKATKECGNGL